MRARKKKKRRRKKDIVAERSGRKLKELLHIYLFIVLEDQCYCGVVFVAKEKEKKKKKFLIISGEINILKRREGKMC